MTDLPNVKLKTLVSFPTTIADGIGVDVVRTGSSYQLNIDFSDFAPATAVVADASHQSALIWNETTGNYSLLLLSAFSLGLPGSALPIVNGAAAVGVSGLYSREDHVHPTDTSRAPLDSPVFTTAASAPTPPAGDNDTSIATTAFVTNALASLKGYLSGLTLSTTAASSTFSIAVGAATDNSNTTLMTLASGYNKTTSAWAVGSAAGALDTGVIANNTWYHVFLIRRTDTNVVDMVISATATPASGPTTMPASYTQYRRIGSLLTNGSAQWTLFSQLGDEFMWTVCPLDINDATLTTVAKLYPLSVPPGVQVMARLRGTVTNVATAALLLNSPDEPSLAASAATGNVVAVVAAAGQLGDWGILDIRTDTSRQIRGIANAVSTNVRAATVGWFDRRGRDG